MIERKKQDNISLLKIKEISNNEYNIRISKSTIHRLLRDNLRCKCVKRHV